MYINSDWIRNFELEPKILLYILIATVIIDNMWDIILLKRQLIVCQTTLIVPEELRLVMPLDIYHRARALEMHKCELEIWKDFTEIIFCCLELYFGFYAFLWTHASNMISSICSKELYISVIFMFMFSIYVSIRFLPVLAYEKFILELRYGTNRSITCGAYMCFACCGTILSQIIIAPLTLLIVYVIQSCGYYFNYYIWLASLIITFITWFLVPHCIIPTIGQQEHIPEGPLYKELKKVTNAAGFPISNIYILRTKSIQYSNAYFYGCCCLKRIIIFDTLLLNKGKTNPMDIPSEDFGRGLTNEQIAGVVAHELGHWKYGHFYKAMIIVKIHLLITLALFGLCFYYPNLYEAVGFEKNVMPIIVGILIVSRFALTPYLTLANFLMLYNLRHFEYQADKYAYELGYSLQLRGALLKIYFDNMHFPIYDHCYSLWNHTHPTILERLYYQQLLDIKHILNSMRNIT